MKHTESGIDMTPDELNFRFIFFKTNRKHILL